MSNRLKSDVKLHRFNRGFSTIELMVAVAIMAIAASIAVPGYTQFVANTKIRSTAESIRNGLQLARAEAIKRNTLVVFTLQNTTAWRFGCVNVIALTCPAIIQSKPAREGSDSRTLINITGGNTVTFTNLGTLTTTPGQMSVINIDQNTQADTRNLRILIGAGGSTKMCDPNIVEVTDARSC